MIERNSTSVDVSILLFPFLLDIQTQRNYIPLKICTSELDDDFLNQSLQEEASEAAGHFNVAKSLFVVRGSKLCPVEVRRSTRKIYPPQYLHYERDIPPDEEGGSETVREALGRLDLTEAQFIVLYTRGSDDYENKVNEILIAPIKK